jgi:hypothetical protein
MLGRYGFLTAVRPPPPPWPPELPELAEPDEPELPLELAPPLPEVRPLSGLAVWPVEPPPLV